MNINGKLHAIEQCNINLQIVNTIRYHLEQLNPSDKERFYHLTSEIMMKIDELGCDEIQLRDAYFAELTR